MAYIIYFVILFMVVFFLPLFYLSLSLSPSLLSLQMHKRKKFKWNSIEKCGFYFRMYDDSSLRVHLEDEFEINIIQSEIVVFHYFKLKITFLQLPLRKQKWKKIRMNGDSRPVEDGIKISTFNGETSKCVLHAVELCVCFFFCAQLCCQISKRHDFIFPDLIFSCLELFLRS